MSFGFVDEHRHIRPVRTICAVLGISASGYYAWRSRPESRRSVENRALLDDIRQTHAESGGCYGAPRIHAALRAAGRRIGRHRIARLMRLAGLRGLAAIPRRVRTTDSRHDYPIAPNRLRRNFTATAPNQVWLADLTYIRTGEGWLFLAALIDMHTRKVVGWSMRETLHASIALEALDMAIRRQRPAPGLIQHSIRGWRLPPSPCRRENNALNEPKGELSRQRTDGELLPHAQSRARPSPRLCHEDRSAP